MATPTLPAQQIAQDPFPVTAPDLVCLDNLDPLAVETTSEVQNLSQDLYHSLLSLPGSNPDVPDRGVGAELYLNGSAEDFAALPGAIEADFLKDFRVQACSASVIQLPDGSFEIDIQVQAVAGVFALSVGYVQGGGFALLKAA